jgi:DNA-binding HxlR family transcriptional regulator
MPESHQPPGACVLRLLAERLTVQVVRELAGGALQPSELQQRMPGATHTAVMRRLGGLARAGAIARKRVPDVPPRAYYELTGAGRGLLPLAGAAEVWERNWSSRVSAGAPGRWALRLLADDGNRTLLRALAVEPLRPTDIDGHLVDLCRSATRRRLGNLVLDEILSRTHRDGVVRYELTAAARRLEPIAWFAAGWEWRWLPSAKRSGSALQCSLERLQHPHHAQPAVTVRAGARPCAQALHEVLALQAQGLGVGNPGGEDVA